jgi:hypothetical protein
MVTTHVYYAGVVRDIVLTIVTPFILYLTLFMSKLENFTFKPGGAPRVTTVLGTHVPQHIPYF